MKALRLMLLGAMMGAFVGVSLYRRQQQRRQHEESEAFWNSPFMQEERRDHEARMKRDPLYRMQWQEMEKRYDL